MKAFIEDHFDKLMLALIVFYLIHVVMYLSWRQSPTEVVSWARELTSGFAGGLLGLITGMRIQNGGSNANRAGTGNNSQDSQKPKEPGSVEGPAA